MPFTASHHDPFRFGRQAIAVYIGMKIESFEERTMSIAIDLFARIRIHRIETVRLAFFVGIQNGIVVSHVFRREILAFARKLEPLGFHQFIEFATSDFVLTHRKWIIHLDFHLGVFFQLCCGIVRSKNCRRIIGRHVNHAVQFIF